MTGRRHRGSGKRFDSVPGVRILVIVAILAVLAAPAYGAAGFVVTYASSGLERGVYYLNANMDLQLNKRARDALANGVALTLVVNIRILHGRKLLWNALIAELDERYRLNYRPLSRSYTVRNVNSGDVKSYDSLSGALAAIGRIRRLPLIDASLLNKHSRYLGTMRIVLDTNDLPGPLRLMAVFMPDWQLASAWHQWVLQP